MIYANESHLSKSFGSLSKFGGFLCDEKSEFCECCAHGKKHESVTFSDSILLHPSKQVMEDGDLGFQLGVKLEYDILISLGREDVLDPIYVLEVQQYSFVPKFGRETSNQSRL